MRWRINPGFNEVCLVRSPEPPPPRGTLIPPEIAAARVHEWFRNDATRMNDVCRALDGALVTRDLPEAQRHRLIHALGDGRLRAYRLPNDLAGEYRPPPKEREREPSEPTTEEHALHVELVYPNGAPAADIAYRRVRPNGEPTEGVTGADGVIEEDPAIAGIHTIELQEVESVFWQKNRMRVDEKSTIEAVVSGYDDGTTVAFRIYREHRELDTDVIDELETELRNGRAQVRWKYEPAAISADHEAEEGVARFIAEAIVGRSWSKTLQPIEVELVTIVSAHWTRDVVDVGQPAELVIQTLGVPDGAVASISVFEVGHEIDDEDLGSIDLEVVGGEARGTWTYPVGCDEDAFWLSPECYFCARVSGREVTSENIWFKRVEDGP